MHSVRQEVVTAPYKSSQTGTLQYIQSNKLYWIHKIATTIQLEALIFDAGRSQLANCEQRLEFPIHPSWRDSPSAPVLTVGICNISK